MGIHHYSTGEIRDEFLLDLHHRNFNPDPAMWMHCLKATNEICIIINDCATRMYIYIICIWCMYVICIYRCLQRHMQKIWMHMTGTLLFSKTAPSSYSMFPAEFSIACPVQSCWRQPYMGETCSRTWWIIKRDQNMCLKKYSIINSQRMISRGYEWV
jgi:hypothetical protein